MYDECENVFFREGLLKKAIVAATANRANVLRHGFRPQDA